MLAENMIAVLASRIYLCVISVLGCLRGDCANYSTIVVVSTKPDKLVSTVVELITRATILASMIAGQNFYKHLQNCSK